MKFDRETIIGIVICIVILIGWHPLARALGWIDDPGEQSEKTEQTAPANAAAATKVQADPAPAAAPSVAIPPKDASAPQQAAQPKVKTVAIPEALPVAKAVRLDNADIQVTIDPNTGAVTSVLLKQYKRTEQPEKPTGFFNAAKHPELKDHVVINARSNISSGALNLAFVGKDDPWRTKSSSLPEKTDRSITLKREMVNTDNGAEITVTQKWSIGDTGYKIDYDVTILNTGSEKLTLPAMEVGGGTFGASRALSGDTVRGDSHYLDFMTPADDYTDIAADKKDEKFFAERKTPVRWAGASNKYFCLILKAGKDKEAFDLTYDRSGDLKEANSIAIAVGMTLPAGELAPGGSESYSFNYYCGPKILHNLKEFDSSTAKLMHLSWGPLNYLAQGMLWILVQFHKLFGSYGLSIIVLTLLVRLIFYPITARGNASMKKMQAIQPKIKELREKYKDNAQLMNTKMMELYRTEGINPFGGCLPILLQIPVFFALYSAFNGAVELRHTSFLWSHNLAAADTVAFVTLPYIATLPINPLVLIMTALMVVQQLLTPMSMDPMQKKMMLFMPIVMLFFFYDLPSGLTLYWTVSNIFSIIQLRLQQRGGKTTEAAGTAKN